MFEDINQIAESKDRVEAVQRQQREYKYDGSAKRVAGHILFSYNTETGEWKQANVKRECVYDPINKKTIYKTKVIRETNCIYIQALNLKNAIKRLNRAMR